MKVSPLSGACDMAIGPPAGASRWYLVRTKAAREALAQENLERQGFETYYPRVMQPALVRRRWIDRVASLFPRYVFLRLDPARQSMGPIRSTLGVDSIVRFGADYTPVPDSIIDTLRQRADPDTGLHRLAVIGVLAAGSRVRIVSGAFDGLEGVFERKSGDQRAIVLLEMLGRQTPVRIPAAFVIPEVNVSALCASVS